MAPFCPTLLLPINSSTNEVLFVSAFAIAAVREAVRPDGPLVGNMHQLAIFIAYCKTRSCSLST